VVRIEPLKKFWSPGKNAHVWARRGKRSVTEKKDPNNSPKHSAKKLNCCYTSGQSWKGRINEDLFKKKNKKEGENPGGTKGKKKRSSFQMPGKRGSFIFMQVHRCNSRWDM